MSAPFPPIISSLPLADVPMPNVRGWLLQGDARQAVFFDLPPGSAVPEHAHGAQWGVVLEGELELTIGADTRVYRRGDSYLIAAGQPHSARCSAGARVLDLFEDPHRYRARP